MGQFLKENNLLRTLQSLQKETGVEFSAVDSIQELAEDIAQGRWELVLRTVAPLSLDPARLADLYEQVRPTGGGVHFEYVPTVPR